MMKLCASKFCRLKICSTIFLQIPSSAVEISYEEELCSSLADPKSAHINSADPNSALRIQQIQSLCTVQSFES
jgi:hypothetical protein